MTTPVDRPLPQPDRSTVCTLERSNTTQILQSTILQSTILRSDRFRLTVASVSPSVKGTYGITGVAIPGQPEPDHPCNAVLRWRRGFTKGTGSATCAVSDIYFADPAVTDRPGTITKFYLPN